MIIKKKFAENDIKDQFLIVAATNNKKANATIAKLAKEKNILVNMAENSTSGNTLIPSVVDRDQLRSLFLLELHRLFC